MLKNGWWKQRSREINSLELRVMMAGTGRLGDIVPACPFGSTAVSSGGVARVNRGDAAS